MTTSSASASDRSSASFDLLSPAVRQWIWQQGWQELHDIQERAIPVLLEGAADVIIVAPTAGGKTEAAFLPLISRIAGSGGAGFKLLYVSPLKALINDQFRRLDSLCEAVELPVHRWHGDVPAAAKTHARQNPDGIVLTTPESLEALLVRRGIEVPGLFTALQAIVIDELHAFLGNPRGIQLQSLLHRLELAVGRRVIRIGLSATLADPMGATSFLRPGGSDRAVILQSQSNRQTVLLQLRAYESIELEQREAPDSSESAGNGPLSVAIARHLFRHLRGDHNLVFTRSRSDVELYADLLRRLSEKAGVSNEFYPHHANLSRGERELLEQRLRDDALPTTAICTSTLELGIDIGEVESVAQIGAPSSVAALRQRLGRSGRRSGKPAIMRLYVTERAWSRDMHPVDMLRCEVVQAIAMVQLLIDGWCEAPRSPSHHLSTLVHQILAVIAQLGGCSAQRAYATLCRDGPFVEVGPALFTRVLRAIGAPEVGLIEQMADGTLLLGEVGERLVEHHDFYSVFETPRQFRIVYNGKELGALPVVTPLLPDMGIIFSGRRWRVLEVHHERATAIVVPSSTGIPPHFGGEGAGLDSAIVSKMRQVYEGNDVPAFVGSAARKLLLEARDTYQMLGLSRTQIIDRDGDTLLFPWTSTTIANLLVLALRAEGLYASLKQIVISVNRKEADQVRSCLELLASGDTSVLTSLKQRPNQRYDRFLPREFLTAALASEQTEFEILSAVAQRIVADPKSSSPESDLDRGED
jgi:ATP-dependent helicase Lhr and Lhr-like helicase